MRDVNANPMAVELLCNLYRCAAATERIENYIAFVGRCFEYAFKECLWLLGWITKAFLSLRIDWEDIRPDVSEKYTGHFV